ncbi:MAG: PorV/PorQ family protein, partial [Bacteroidota bacterium]
MKQYLPKSLILGSALGWMLCAALPAMAGNKDRIGQAGANELLINPWSRSTGWGSANTASVTGLESVNLNVAGLAFTNKTEVIFSNTSWLRGSDININAFGLAQRLSESSVLGLAVMSMNFGDIDVTTTNLPEGGLGTFSPQYLNVGVSYAREFSNSIYGGITMKAISESTADVGAQGIAFDMGIRYVTGEKDQIKFGIGLRNVGPKMSFSGDGLATSVNINNNEFTLVQRTDGFELPAVLNIGFSYDYYLVERIDSTGKGAKADHRITGAGNFTSNSFGKDQIHVGVEYGYKNFFMLRAGFV